MADFPQLNSKDLQELKSKIGEMTRCLARVDAENEHKKDICTDTSKQFNLSKKMVNNLAKAMYKQNFHDIQQEHEAFEYLYESLTMKEEQSQNNEE